MVWTGQPRSQGTRLWTGLSIVYTKTCNNSVMDSSLQLSLSQAGMVENAGTG